MTAVTDEDGKVNRQLDQGQQEEPLGQFFMFDSSSDKQEWLLVCPSGHHIRLGQLAYEVLSKRWSGLEFESISSDFEASRCIQVAPDEIAHYFAQLTDKIKTITARAPQSDQNFKLRLTIFSSEAVRIATRPLLILYSKAYSLTLLVILVLSLFAWFGTRWSMHEPAWSITSVAIAYLIYVATLIFHELGHASATAYFGESPGPIGFTLYMIFPALYSNVTPSWKLKRWQRVVVDIGGEYFQMLALAPILWVDMLVKWPPAHIAAIMVMATSIFNLNPFFKFDGYWILSDALGVHNLMDRARVILGSIVTKNQERVGYPKAIIFALVAYAVVSTGALLYIIVSVAIELFLSAGSFLSAVEPDIRDGKLPPVSFFVHEGGSMILAVVASYFLLNMLTQLTKSLSSSISARRSTRSTVTK